MKTHDRNVKKGLAAVLVGALACALGAASAGAEEEGASGLPALAGRMVEEGNGSTGEAEKLPRLKKLDAVLHRMLEDRDYAEKFFEGYDSRDENARKVRNYFLTRLKQKIGADPMARQERTLQMQLLRLGIPRPPEPAHLQPRSYLPPSGEASGRCRRP